MHHFDGLRRRYRPDETSVLFVGESPPYRRTFFYDNEHRSKLRSFTEGAMREVLGDRIGLDFLASFRRLGCYLDDLCLAPINQIKDQRLRRAARVECQPKLAERLRSTPHRVMVGIGIGCTDNFTAAAAAGVAQPAVILPFPARPRDEERYRRELKELTAELDGAGLFLE
jgi:hypothetical protein